MFFTSRVKPTARRPARPRSYRPTAEALENRVLLDVSFLNARRDYETGAGGSFLGVTSADFNGDLLPDLAAVTDTGSPSSFGSHLIIRLGHGDGSFGPFQAYPVGGRPADVVPGDFNGDGVTDLVTANSGSSSVSVLLGNGDGTFQAARDFGVQRRPEGIGVADLDRDGVLDLAVANYDSKTVSVLLGNGDGTFRAAQHLPTAGPFGGASPTAVVVADLNGDSALDLVAAAIGNYPLSVFLGNGDGTFQMARAVDAGPSPAALAVGDFNGDLIPDLAAGGFASPPRVFILLGLGDGTFGPPQGFAAGPDTLQDVEVADFNGDLAYDLVVANWLQASASVLLGNGDGTFGPPQTFRVGGAANAVTVTDFNLDGLADVAVAAAFQVSVLLGDGLGGFLQPPTYPTGGRPNAVAVGDFNLDGFHDVAVTNAGSNTVTVLLSNSDGTFVTAGEFAVGAGPNSVGVGDFNGDGVPDLATANSTSDSVSILLGLGDGTFVVQDFAALNNSYSLTVGDFNGDELLDVAFLGLVGASYNVAVMLGNGDGTLQAPLPRGAGNLATSVDAGDFNGDGLTDLAVESRDFQNRSVVSVLLSNGDGTFRPSDGHRFVNARDGSRVRVADFNGDGVLDLLVINGYRATVYLLVGNGDGTFRPVSTLEGVLELSGARDAAVADFDGDGVPDLAVTGGLSHFAVRPGSGGAQFAGRHNFGVGLRPTDLAVGDFNGDGRPDVAVVNNGSADVTVLINTAGGGTAPGPGAGGVIPSLLAGKRKSFDPSALEAGAEE